MEKIDLHTVKPAEYNPRILTDDAKDKLKESLSELGCIKPIIVNKKNMTIIAGHQRTKTMLEMGITECPAFILDNIETSDEIRFNQFHNRCEYEINKDAPVVKIKGNLVEGINRINNNQIEILDTGKLGLLNAMLCRLLILYGEFGCPVVDLKGNVVLSSAYAMATKRTGHDLFVIALNDEKIEKAIKYFSQDYGKFCYDNLEKRTYHQGLAQQYRLRDGKKGKGNSFHSTLYERLVIPYIQKLGKSIRILDFGAGKMDYAKKLKSEGWNILAVEPYYFKEKTFTIDFQGNKNRYIKVCKELREKGQFDVVICDSVLNSVDSMEAEEAVILTCKALAKIGGKIFMSGRKLEKQVESENNRKVYTANSFRAGISFMDENGFTGQFRSGNWFYQKSHDENNRKRVLSMLGKGEIVSYHDRTEFFAVVATKDEEHDIRSTLKALEYEFDMLLPNGKSYGLGNEIKEAYENRISET